MKTGQWRYSSTHPSSWQLDGGEWSHIPATLAPEKTPWCALNRKLGGSWS